MCEQPLIPERTMQEITRLVLRKYLSTGSNFMCATIKDMKDKQILSPEQAWAISRFVMTTIYPHDTLYSYFVDVLDRPVKEAQNKRAKAKFLLQKLATVPDLSDRLFS